MNIHSVKTRADLPLDTQHAIVMHFREFRRDAILVRHDGSIAFRMSGDNNWITYQSQDIAYYRSRWHDTYGELDPNDPRIEWQDQ